MEFYFLEKYILLLFEQHYRYCGVACGDTRTRSIELKVADDMFTKRC